MDSVLGYARQHQPALIAFLRELVECESPSHDAAALQRCGQLFAERIRDVADTEVLPGGHLRCTFRLPGQHRDVPQLLALGHHDTVWPLGTLAHMPFREADGRLWGPGVLDMKAGLAFFVFALRALRDLSLPVACPVVLLVNADEEVGSPSSRPITEDEARRSRAVLVLEPGTGLDGRLKTARKGVGHYEIHVTGRAAHAGVDFTAGANAIVELAKQIEVIAGFTRVGEGITVNPGVIQGGTRSNVVPAQAMAEIDIRIATRAQEAVLAAQFAALRPFDPRCEVKVTGGLNRPPLERTPAIADLFAQARSLAAGLGIALEESATGGGSDGNFTAALGIPTLDGLGAVGEGAHAAHESILVDRIADRTALLAHLVLSLCR